MRQPIYQGPLDIEQECFCQLASFAPFGAHWHSEIEIIYVLSGCVECMAEGKPHTVRAGEAIFFGSAEVHELAAVSEDNRLLVLEMGYHLIGERFRVFTEMIPILRVLPLEAPEYAPLRDVLLRLCSHLEDSHTAKTDLTALRTNALLYDVAATFLECCPCRSLTEERSRHVGDFLAMYNTLGYVQRHYKEPLDVLTAASAAGYEKTRFCQLFKRAIGVSFHRYLSVYRVEKAKRLLSETENSVSDIAESVGITEAKTFTRLFKSVMGMTPTEYRRQIKKGT